MSNPLTINPETEPERLIPLREVPRAILDMRERWAQAYTLANQFERENAELRAQLTAIRNRETSLVDDLTAHSVAQGEYIARLEDRLRTLQKQSDAKQIRIGHLADIIEREYDRGTLTELAEGPAGRDCPNCEGTGEVGEEAENAVGLLYFTGRPTPCTDADCLGGRTLR